MTNDARLKPHMHKIGPWGHKQYIFGDHFWSKNARTLSAHVFLHFNARKHLTSSFFINGPNSQEIVSLFQYSSGPLEPTIGTKFTISCEFGPLQAK